jgi:hypothetical protein
MNMKVKKGIESRNVELQKLVSSMDIDIKEVHHEMNAEEVIISLSSIAVLKDAPTTG